MILYALRCECGHAFDGWFQNSGAFESQCKRKLVTCTACGSANVEKAIMAPRLTRKGSKKILPPKQTEAVAETNAAPLDKQLVMAPQEREFLTKLRKLRDHVVKGADNVGEKFPEEARKMHYGEIEHRPIYGGASLDEARALADEGIDVLPLPLLPDDRN